jgi:hypothetical protein
MAEIRANRPMALHAAFCSVNFMLDSRVMKTRQSKILTARRAYVSLSGHNRARK